MSNTKLKYNYEQKFKTTTNFKTFIKLSKKINTNTTF